MIARMRRRAFGVRLVGGLIGCLGAGTPVGAQDTAAEPTWARNARAIHGSFTGPPGTLALFGDSITESLAFWAPGGGAQAGPAEHRGSLRTSQGTASTRVLERVAR